MEPANNIYVFHQGEGTVTPKKAFLFVFPYTENLTLDIMVQHAVAAFGEKSKKLLDRSPKFRAGSIDDSVLKPDVEQHGSKRAIMTVYTYYGVNVLSVRTLTSIAARRMASVDLASVESKMNEIIKLYETVTADTPASKMSTVLEGKNIYYYNERKIPGYTFDKRSPEGVEFIKEKLLAKREKQLIQRAHKADAKRRDQCIEESRADSQDN
ncbi:hypothetical protein FBU31_006443 [Coemansia sp. 'formosensis']|nr:hypothetical protein FBU31_006443 [Coemansia sp. 'formosensis']